MVYPDYFTQEDIMQFEQEYNQYLDLADPYSLASINKELQIVAEKQHQESAENLDILLNFSAG